MVVTLFVCFYFYFRCVFLLEEKIPDCQPRINSFYQSIRRGFGNVPAYTANEGSCKVSSTEQVNAHSLKE